MVWIHETLSGYSLSTRPPLVYIRLSTLGTHVVSSTCENADSWGSDIE